MTTSAPWRAVAWLILLFLACALSACGGGGGSASSPTFPLRASLNALARASGAYQLTASGTAATSAVDGDCTGTWDQTYAAVSGTTTFHTNSSALSQNVTAYLNFTGPSCSFSSGSAPLTIAETDYYNSADLALLGVVVSGAATPLGNYGLYEGGSAFPQAVSVGSGGSVGTISFYADSSFTAPRLSSTKLSYAIEADGASTAIVKLVSEGFNASDSATTRSVVRYRIDTQGRLWIVSQELLQLDTTPQKRLVFRCQQVNCQVGG